LPVALVVFGAPKRFFNALLFHAVVFIAFICWRALCFPENSLKNTLMERI